MARHPRLQGRELIAALKPAGFLVARSKGSHFILKHSDGRSTVIPVHAGETLGPGLYNKILRDLELSNDDILRLL